jgi:hypothetical protein
MTRIPTSLRTAAACLGDRREIGPIGTAARMVGGLIAIGLPIVLGGFGWWDAAVGVDILTPASGDVALWVWLGGSMLVAAARGFGGCEVLAIPNLITGRRDQIGCILFTPIDRAEARRAAHRGESLGALRWMP